MTLDEFVDVHDSEDPTELQQFAAFQRYMVANDPDFARAAALTTTLGDWKGELNAWRALQDIMGSRVEGPMLALEKFVASLEGLEHPTELDAFAASTREDARHDDTFRLERRTVDWRREFEAWRLTQKLLRAGALQALTGDQLKALSVEPDVDQH